jgi:uncharacterized protein (DUF2126 family)
MAQPQANLAEGGKPTVVVVHRGLSHEWKVTPVGQSKPQTFSDLELAVGYAQIWAAIHRPSTVRVLADGGWIEEEWSFH